VAIEKLFIKGDNTVVGFVNHAYVVSNESQITNCHLLVDETRCIGGDKH